LAEPELCEHVRAVGSAVTVAQLGAEGAAVEVDGVVVAGHDQALLGYHAVHTAIVTLARRWRIGDTARRRRSARDGHVIAFTRRAWPVAARRDAGELAEVVDQMGLVEVAVGGRHGRPVDVVAAGTDSPQHPLQPAYPAECLGRRADGGAEAAM